jgi:hypothetical protein
MAVYTTTRDIMACSICPVVVAAGFLLGAEGSLQGFYETTRSWDTIKDTLKL